MGGADGTKFTLLVGLGNTLFVPLWSIKGSLFALQWGTTPWPSISSYKGVIRYMVPSVATYQSPWNIACTKGSDAIDMFANFRTTWLFSFFRSLVLCVSFSQDKNKSACFLASDAPIGEALTSSFPRKCSTIMVSIAGIYFHNILSDKLGI